MIVHVGYSIFLDVVECHSVLCRCWLGDRKSIQSVLVVPAPLPPIDTLQWSLVVLVQGIW